MPQTESDAPQRDQGQQLVAAELGIEGTGGLLLGDLGKFRQILGDADITASMEHLSAAVGGAAGAWSLSRASPVPQFLCKVSKVTRRCCRRAGA